MCNSAEYLCNYNNDKICLCGDISCILKALLEFLLFCLFIGYRTVPISTTVCTLIMIINTWLISYIYQTIGTRPKTGAFVFTQNCGYSKAIAQTFYVEAVHLGSNNFTRTNLNKISGMTCLKALVFFFKFFQSTLYIYYFYLFRVTKVRNNRVHIPRKTKNLGGGCSVDLQFLHFGYRF